MFNGNSAKEVCVLSQSIRDISSNGFHHEEVPVVSSDHRRPPVSTSLTQCLLERCHLSRLELLAPLRSVRRPISSHHVKDGWSPTKCLPGIPMVRGQRTSPLLQDTPAVVNILEPPVNAYLLHSFLPR